MPGQHEPVVRRDRAGQVYAKQRPDLGAFARTVHPLAPQIPPTVRTSAGAREFTNRAGGPQNVRMAICAGAASSPVISSSRRLKVMEQPAMSSEVQ